MPFAARHRNLSKKKKHAQAGAQAESEMPFHARHRSMKKKKK